MGLAAAALTILDGCTTQGSNLPNAKTSSCGTGTCIDLTDPANADLATTGGAMLVDHGSDLVMVIRTSATTVVALSAICTHAGCSLDFDTGAQRLTCPCHGSVFDESGRVVNGPARVPLHVYNASMANNVITLA